MFEQKFAFSLMVFFCSHAVISLLIFYCFFGFFDRIFQSGFPNPSIVHSRPSILFEPSIFISG